MTKKAVTKLSDKLAKINESLNIYMYDNGFMVETGGRDKKGDYANAKIVCNTLEDVLNIVREAAEMERDN